MHINFHLMLLTLLQLCLLLLPAANAQAMLELPVDVNEMPINLVEIPRTSILARIPFFRNFLRAVRPNAHVGRKSDYRSEFDENYINYHGAQLWKVIFNATRKRSSFNKRTEMMQTFVEKFGTEVWNINQDGIDVLIDYKNTAKAKEFIAKTDFTYNIMIDDIETAIDETYTEVNNSNANMPWLDRDSTILNWNRYHDIGDIQQFLQHILETYPDLAEIVQIGVTHHKRPLEVLRISNGNPKNWAVFIDAGMQARDWLSPAALTLAISKLTWLWDNEPSVMHNIDWYFLPVANPDGYQYARITDRLWTKNRYFDSQTGCYGVNLNRNYDYQWGGAGSSENPCKNLFRGPKKFSEPETKAIRTFMHNMREFLGAYVSFGAYGQAIAYPWGDADYVTDNQRKLHNVARRAMLNFRKLNQAEYRVGTSYRLKLARAGNSADWVQQRINPQYVYNVFLKDQGRYGYLMPPHYIVESGEEVYEFMKTIATALN
ncbi:PREDICTED: carboxypeptidase B isoform X1 [Bactrocera latifrons]|uniref:Carboxypeptidase B n=1 Tax=Bactrocera latifrons TaxID=174628 RepID=A0A0K8WJ56_BACLA|nr:PREDICTED: carboxypeptidase B isoform X1 [Bactrocera latifrons]